MNVTIRIGDTIENFSSEEAEIVVSCKKEQNTHYLHKRKGFPKPGEKSLTQIHEDNFYKKEK